MPFATDRLLLFSLRLCVPFVDALLCKSSDTLSLHFCMDSPNALSCHVNSSIRIRWSSSCCCWWSMRSLCCSMINNWSSMVCWNLRSSLAMRRTISPASSLLLCWLMLVQCGSSVRLHQNWVWNRSQWWFARHEMARHTAIISMRGSRLWYGTCETNIYLKCVIALKIFVLLWCHVNRIKRRPACVYGWQEV